MDLCPLSLFGRPFFSSSFLRHALPRQLARTLSAARLATPARTRAPRAHERRPVTNYTTCGPPEWLTGKLQHGVTRSVRSPPRRAPLLATPIATPLQGGRPERSGLLFLKLPCLSKPNYRAPKWALMFRRMQKERLKSPQNSLIIENQAFGVILAIFCQNSYFGSSLRN